MMRSIALRRVNRNGSAVAGAIDERTTRHRHRGIAVVGAGFMLNLITYNLVRIPKLIAA